MNKYVNLIKRAMTTLKQDTTGKYPRVQCTYFGKTKIAQVLSPYGLYGSLPVGSLLLLFNTMGEEEKAVGIGECPEKTFNNLKEGEVIVGNPVTGSFIKFNSEGNIEILSGDITVTGNDVQITAENVKVEATNVEIEATNVEIKADTDIKGKTNLGIGGQPIARQGDTVQVDPITHSGTITSGSINNRSN